MKSIIRRDRIIDIAACACLAAALFLLMQFAAPTAVFAGGANDNEAEDEIYKVRAERFQDTRIILKQKKCKANSKGISLEWSEVAGAEEYLVYRSAERDGPYKEFATTEEPKLKQDTDGEYYYKVRATNGSKYSRWSPVVHIFSQSGYVKKMYYDDYGNTHFLIHVDNRSGRSAFFFGPGLYNPYRTPLYSVCKFEKKTVIEDGEEKVKKEDIEYPYPLTAAPRLSMYQCLEVKPGGDGADLDIYVPWKLTKYGEDGLGNDTYGYRIEISAFPQQRMPAFVLAVTGEEKESASAGRIDK